MPQNITPEALIVKSLAPSGVHATYQITYDDEAEGGPLIGIRPVLEAPPGTFQVVASGIPSEDVEAILYHLAGTFRAVRAEGHFK